MINPNSQIGRLKEEIKAAKNNHIIAKRMEKAAKQTYRAAEDALSLSSMNEIFYSNNVVRLRRELDALEVVAKEIKESEVPIKGYTK